MTFWLRRRLTLRRRLVLANQRGHGITGNHLKLCDRIGGLRGVQNNVNIFVARAFRQAYITRRHASPSVTGQQLSRRHAFTTLRLRLLLTLPRAVATKHVYVCGY